MCKIYKGSCIGLQKCSIQKENTPESQIKHMQLADLLQFSGECARTEALQHSSQTRCQAVDMNEAHLCHYVPFTKTDFQGGKKLLGYIILSKMRIFQYS